jgi:prepilin-type processing-associated H-X9-DG protein
MDNLKQIVVALQSYHASHGCFPPAYLADKNGKPMHSWRTLILPYMDCAGLYQLYDFTEPWDGPKNRKLLAFRPACYACPRDPPANTSRDQQTNYFAVVGPNSAWAGDRPRKAGDFLGKDSDTIMVVEVAKSGVGWSEPRDCSCDSLRAPSEASGALDLSSNHGSRTDFFYTYNRNPEVNVAFADGHVFCLQYDGITPANLRKMLQIGGCTEEIMDAWNDIFVSEPQLNWPNIAALAVWLLSVGTLLTCAVRSRKPVSVPPTVPGVMGAKTD